MALKSWLFSLSFASPRITDMWHLAQCHEMLMCLSFLFSKQRQYFKISYTLTIKRNWVNVIKWINISYFLHHINEISEGMDITTLSILFIINSYKNIVWALKWDREKHWPINNKRVSLKDSFLDGTSVS